MFEIYTHTKVIDRNVQSSMETITEGFLKWLITMWTHTLLRSVFIFNKCYNSFSKQYHILREHSPKYSLIIYCNNNFRTFQQRHFKEKLTIISLTRISESDIFLQVSFLFFPLKIIYHTLRTQFLNLLLVNTRTGS